MFGYFELAREQGSDPELLKRLDAFLRRRSRAAAKRLAARESYLVSAGPRGARGDSSRGFAPTATVKEAQGGGSKASCPNTASGRGAYDQGAARGQPVCLSPD